LEGCLLKVNINVKVNVKVNGKVNGTDGSRCNRGDDAEICF
jgi:hypothetical protein